MLLKNKNILITGGAGSIGSELTRQLVKNNHIFILDINETELFDLLEELRNEDLKIQGEVGDIRKKEELKKIFKEFRPQIIFHAAARKHLTPMEWTPMEAIETNVLGSYNVFSLSKEYGVEKVINISTDKVVNSNSIMGTTKRIAELMARNFGFISVRFGNVLGSRGSVIPIWQKQINEKKDITITDRRMKRYFMTIQEACELVIKASEIGNKGEIIILDMGEKINILDLAKKIIEKSRQNIKIKEIGIREGESLEEDLMFEKEKLVAKKVNNFWIIPNGK